MHFAAISWIHLLALLIVTKCSPIYEFSTDSHEPDVAHLQIQEESKYNEVLECGCCCGDNCREEMVHCDLNELHLVCKPCAKQTAEDVIGLSRTEIRCASHGLECEGKYSDVEVGKFLQGKEYENWSEMCQAQEIAGIPDFEKCPFCAFGMEMNAGCEPMRIKSIAKACYKILKGLAGYKKHKGLFQCLRPSCGKVSCRDCRKESHEGMRCGVIEASHRIAEAMTARMIRKCPNGNCAQPYLKLEGCNHITCSKCRIQSCYLCGETIDGTSHFRGKCNLEHGDRYDNRRNAAETIAVIQAGGDLVTSFGKKDPILQRLLNIDIIDVEAENRAYQIKKALKFE